MTLWLITLLIGALLLSAISIVIWSIRNGISPMPSSPAAMQCLIEALPEKLEGTIVDLGSGWGSLIFPISKKMRHCKVIGYENSPVPYFFSKCRHLLIPRGNLKIHRQDFFQTDLKNVSAVICYLYPGAMEKLKYKLEKELKQGSWVFSNTFAIPGWIPYDVFQMDDLYQTKVYVYRV